MNVNLHLSGETESYVRGMVKRGLAANNTEAIRMLIVKCRDREVERWEIDRFQQASIEHIWNNKKDDEAAKFYEKRYLGGKKK